MLKQLFRPVYRYSLYLYSLWKFYRIKSKRESLMVFDSWDTIDYIKRERCSISRFGDGELSLILKYSFGENFHSNFQDYNPALAKRLSDILKYKNPIHNHIVGLPACGFSVGTSKFKWNIAEYWNRYMYSYIDEILQMTNNNYKYIDTNFTRFYMDYVDSSWCPKYVDRLKTIWESRDVVFIEGETTRLGAGNNLFSTAKSVRRILCPAKNAIDKYDEIINVVRRNVNKDDLIIIALGMTATLMAYDLAKEGFQALDLGHIDIEYEWFRVRAKEKIAISGKFTNENSKGKNNITDGDDLYKSQIIARVL